MPQAVCVADVCSRMAVFSWMAFALEVGMNCLLKRFSRHANFEGVYGDFVSVHHLTVNVLDFGRGVADAPGSRAVVEVTAANFAREEVEDNWLSLAERRVGVAPAVRKTTVAPL